MKKTSNPTDSVTSNAVNLNRSAQLQKRKKVRHRLRFSNTLGKANINKYQSPVQRQIILGESVNQKTLTLAFDSDIIKSQLNLKAQDIQLFYDWLLDEDEHKYNDEKALFDNIRKAAARTNYHFGLTAPEAPTAKSILGPRMDYIKETGAGTVAEYDWAVLPNGNISWENRPDHIHEKDHERLTGKVGRGYDIFLPEASKGARALAVQDRRWDAKEQDALNSNIMEKIGELPRVLKYTYLRKRFNLKKPIGKITTEIGEDKPHTGVDFSKAALIDQLVQKKHIHFHLTGMKARWRDAKEDMNGKDFMHVLNKENKYSSQSTPKEDVTFRELRFVWRYWKTRELTIYDDAGIQQEYSFEGNVSFYYNGKEVPPPWDWPEDKTGETIQGQ